MVEKRSARDMIGEPSITNIDLNCDDEDLIMAVSQENQSDHSPVKKRRTGDHKIPKENTTAPAHKYNDQSKVEDNQIPLERFPDQSERKGPDPTSRVLPPVAYCLSKTLNSKDVIPINPELYLSNYDVFILTGCLKNVCSLRGSCEKNLVVFDEGHRKYNMILSNQIRGEYNIYADWERFVKVHNLQDGDKISFYRFWDVNVSDDYSYILKYVRKGLGNKDIDAPNSRKLSDAGRKVKNVKKKKDIDAHNSTKSSDAGRKVKNVKKKSAVSLENIPDKKKRNVKEPDFSRRRRTMPREAYCLSKTLTSIEVVKKNAKLYFDPYDASVLTDCPEIGRYPLGEYREDLTVFDGWGRKYTMTLSHCISGGVIRSYCINTGWNTFLRKHNLKEGYELTFYRFRKTSACKFRYYYVLEYFKKPPDQFKNKPSYDASEKDQNTILLSKTNEESKVRDNEGRTENSWHRKKRNAQGPDSSIHHRRVMTREAYCLSKTLTSIEVVKENAKLYFDPYDASVLTDCPEIGRYPLGQHRKDLIVFDGKGRKYIMNLSHCISGGVIRSYCINIGWNRFLRQHNLKEGSELTFYRFRKTSSFKLEYYYVLKYFKKPPDTFQNKPSDDAGQKDKNTILRSKKNEESKVRDDEKEEQRAEAGF